MIFEPVIRTPAAWTSVLDKFAVHLFEGQVTLAEMDDMQRVGERWNARHPGKRVEMAVIFPSNARMSLEERARMAQLIKTGEAFRAASATVILAQGMLASVQRSMLTGMLMLVPAPHPARVFGSIPDAVEWIAPHLRTVASGALALEPLTAALDAHVAEFRARAARAP